MPECPRCGYTNPDGARYCVQCGLNLQEIPVEVIQSRQYPRTGVASHLAYAVGTLVRRPLCVIPHGLAAAATYGSLVALQYLYSLELLSVPLPTGSVEELDPLVVTLGMGYILLTIFYALALYAGYRLTEKAQTGGTSSLWEASIYSVSHFGSAVTAYYMVFVASTLFIPRLFGPLFAAALVHDGKGIRRAWGGSLGYLRSRWRQFIGYSLLMIVFESALGIFFGFLWAPKIEPAFDALLGLLYFSLLLDLYRRYKAEEGITIKEAYQPEPKRSRLYRPIEVSVWSTLIEVSMMSVFLGLGDALISAVVFGVSQWMGYFDWRSYFKEHNWRRTVQMGTLFGLLMQGLGIFVINPLFYKLSGEQPTDTFAFLSGNLPLSIIWLLFIWFFAGFLEELFYRGYLYNRVRELAAGRPWAVYAAAASSSAVFAVAHRYQGYTAVASMFIVGLMFCCLYENSDRNIVFVMVVHGFLDTVAVILNYLR
jgi:membrane protease YdiL (CAAX protease family)